MLKDYQRIRNPYLFQPVPFVHHQSVLLPGHCEVHWDLQHLQQLASPLFDRSKSPFRIYDIFCSEYIIYSVQNTKNILHRTYDIFWAEYIIYCAHLVGILDLWDLSDGKGEGKVHLLLPRRLVCKSQIEIPDTINKLCFLNKKKNLLTEEGWLGDLVAPGYTPRNRLVTQARVRVLHQGTKLPSEFKFCILCKVSIFSQNWCLPKQRKYDLQRTSANF